ncbi:MAG: hypothetical protein M1837_004505 [Sclerophora amabilis]|nr:MAG: hypothetical protein M1837_004505 [Sclerophora amabilis]
MSVTIESMPFEILSNILNEAAYLNERDNVAFSYGLTEAPLPFQKTRLHKQVDQRWHDWALAHSLRDLSIARWRGSERWMESHSFASSEEKPSGIAVYRDSFSSLKSTTKLLAEFPAVASYVRKIRFIGFYVAETDALIFKLLRNCSHLRVVSLPWTTMRRGSLQDWSSLLSSSGNAAGMRSLELLATGLKESQIVDPRNEIGPSPFDESEVTFSQLTRLKVFGDSNFHPVNDQDLKSIARTAMNLEEVHITQTASVTIAGVMDLVKASRESLRILEFSPLLEGEDGKGDHRNHSSNEHLCELLVSCPRLIDLSVSLPSVCPALFSNSGVQWSGDLQIRANSFCAEDVHNPNVGSASQIWQVLDGARSLISSRAEAGVDLSIEIVITHWIFQPKHRLVHGNFDLAEVSSDFSWPSGKKASGKGPYGSTGIHGKDENPYSCVSEDVFREGLLRGYVSF